MNEKRRPRHSPKQLSGVLLDVHNPPAEIRDAGGINWACMEVSRKKDLDPSAARLQIFNEGLCVQYMHYGPFDNEPATVAKIEAFLGKNGLISEIDETRRHHEIYLGDPRKTSPERMRTVLHVYL
ncbi:hypothetical protein SDC9_45847 [bioreactor metagenome]|uniref:GyrI-like small molecule binding domain-containing protein n=1 Tax=bioreactor metagenome TaxID=1076179 RepID=A0A644W793_9ZZZZ